MTSPHDIILRQTITDISNFIPKTHTVHIFTVKWHIIRAKLEQLSSSMATAESTSSVTPLLGLISEVGVTLVKCRALVNACHMCEHRGKLQLQSDLDMIISRLEEHTANLTSICSFHGLISDGVFALVVSKPGGDASKEEMRFYVNDLLTRVKIGDAEMKLEALVSIKKVVFEDERYLKALVEVDGLVMQVVYLLESTDDRVQEAASVIASEISRTESYKEVLLRSGVVERLIRLVEMGSSLKAKQNSIKCLGRLTEGGDNAWAFSSHGGVTTLLNICSSDNGGVLAGLACRVLGNLLVVDEIRRFMIEQGVIETLIILIKRSDQFGQIGAIEFLQELLPIDKSASHLVVRHGGVRALVRLMDPKLNLSLKLRATALKAIENLCFTIDDYVNLVINLGFLDQLLFYLMKGDVPIQELAFKSASRLCTSDKTRKIMGDIGFMQEFVKFLGYKSYEMREMASESLACMMTVGKNQKKFSQEDGNICSVLRLLDPDEGYSGNFKFLLSILLSATDCKNGRKRILQSGYIKNIENLANAGVSDANKIVRKLTSNRFTNILNVIKKKI